MIDLRLARQLTHSVIESFFSKGILTEQDLLLPDQEFNDKFLKLVKSTPLGIIADYRQGILNQADIFLKAKNYDYSRLFFATFFEHSLNALIENECNKRGINEKTKIEIIRSVDLYGKLTWLPKLLGYPVFNPKHLKTIKKLADDRNAFVHYKWKMSPDDLSDYPGDKEVSKEFKNIKLAVRYMKKYESTVFFNRNKRKLKKKLSKKSKD